MLLEVALAAALPLAFAFDGAEHVNATYTVSCLAGHIACSRDLYDRLWHTELHWSDEDQRELDRWTQVIERAEHASPAIEPAPLLPNFQSYYPSVRARMAIVAAVSGAGSSGRVAAAAQGLVPAEDGAALQRVLQHFERRLRPWWRSTGAAVVARHIEQVRRGMTAEHLHTSAAVSSFMGARLPDARVFVHAVPSPAPAGDESAATVVQQHFFVEVVARDIARETIWKAMHELTHAYYDAAPAAVHTTLMRQFVASTEPSAPAFYTYFNEAIATAVQFVVLERDGEPLGSEEDGYRHPYIPRLARALLPVVRRVLAAGGSITQGVVEAYLAAGRASLGDRASSPAFTLASAALIGNDAHQPAITKFRRAFNVWFTVGTVDEWRKFEELSGVFFVTYPDLPPDLPTIPDLDQASRHRAFAFTARHHSKSRVIVLAGRDAAAVAELVDRLAPVTSWPNDGVFLVID